MDCFIPTALFHGGMAFSRIALISLAIYKRINKEIETKHLSYSYFQKFSMTHIIEGIPCAIITDRSVWHRIRRKCGIEWAIRRNKTGVSYATIDVRELKGDGRGAEMKDVGARF